MLSLFLTLPGGQEHDGVKEKFEEQKKLIINPQDTAAQAKLVAACQKIEAAQQKCQAIISNSGKRTNANATNDDDAPRDEPAAAPAAQHGLTDDDLEAVRCGVVAKIRCAAPPKDVELHEFDAMRMRLIAAILRIPLRSSNQEHMAGHTWALQRQLQEFIAAHPQPPSAGAAARGPAKPGHAAPTPPALPAPPAFLCTAGV